MARCCWNEPVTPQLLWARTCTSSEAKTSTTEDHSFLKMNPACRHQCVAWHCRQQLCEGVCKLDTVSKKWSTGFLQPPFDERKYHTANLVGSDIWVVGGCDQRAVSSHTYVFDTHTLQWRTATLRSGMLPCSMLSRCCARLSRPVKPCRKPGPFGSSAEVT